MSRPALIVLAILSFMPGRARAEQPIPPTCKCNDDCVSKWPYSGICVQYSWGKVCGYSGSGPGVPCTDGGPAPDLKKDVWFGCGDAMPNCSCDDDCKPHGLAFCVKHPSSLCAPICSNKGPGIACAKKDVGPEGPSHRPCRCNAECASVAGMPYCAYQSGAWFCSAVGPGVSCPDDVPRAYALQGRRGSPPALEGYARGGVLGSYVHVHFASCAGAAAGFVESCVRRRG